MLAFFPITAFFLSALGLMHPRQHVLFALQIFYGGPTLAIFYFSRSIPSHWDSLYLVFGLCFFTLPKISPLNFIFAFYGSSAMTGGFLYMSARRLHMQEWILSSIFLVFVAVLFM